MESASHGEWSQSVSLKVETNMKERWDTLTAQLMKIFWEKP